jgi:hypothetical protein
VALGAVLQLNLAIQLRTAKQLCAPIAYAKSNLAKDQRKTYVDCEKPKPKNSALNDHNNCQFQPKDFGFSFRKIQTAQKRVVEPLEIALRKNISFRKNPVHEF